MNAEEFIAKVKEVMHPYLIKESIERQRNAWNLVDVDYPPLIVNCQPPPLWTNFRYIETFYDMEKMLISELAPVYQHCTIGDDFIPCVRANYGVVVTSNAFGCEIKIPEDVRVFEKTYTIGPWAKPTLSQDPPDLSCLRRPDPRRDGLMKKVLETEEYFLGKLRDTEIRVSVCDTQGPLDNALMVRGSKFITDLYRYPSFANNLMDLMADVYIEFNMIQKRVIGEPLAQGVTKGVGDGIWMDRGGVRLCADAIILLSRKIYERFCMPIFEKSFEPFGGGILHTCGDVNHLLEAIVSTRGVKALNLGNPEMYRLNELLKLCRKNDVCLIWSGGPQPGQGIEKWVKEVSKAMGKEKTGIIFSVKEGQDTTVAKKLVATWKHFFEKR